MSHFIFIFVLLVILIVVVVQRLRKVPVEGVPVIPFRKGDLQIYEKIKDANIGTNEKLIILKFLFTPCVVVTHPDAVRDLLKNDDVFQKNKFLWNSFFGELLKGSILFANGDDWKHQRSTMAPAFHYEYLKGVVPFLVQKSEEVIEKLPKGESVDVVEWMNHFTIDVLGLISFGVDFKTLSEEASEYCTSYKILLAQYRDALRSLIPLLKEKLPLPSTRRLKAAKDTMSRLTQEIVESRKGESNKTFLIDMMLAAKPSLSPKELETNLFLFFAAGHETTATALDWGFFILAKHQDIQTRVREEVDQVLGGKHVEAEKLKDLIYLDMFIKEVMRFGSPVPVVTTRKTVEDAYIDKYFIPKNTYVGYGIHAIHHNPEFWPSPEVFDPERFNPEKVGKQHPYAFLPFAIGRRVCIGNNFSMMEQKVFWSLLLQKYIVTKGDDMKFVLDDNTFGNCFRSLNIILTKR